MKDQYVIANNLAFISVARADVGEVECQVRNSDLLFLSHSIIRAYGAPGTRNNLKTGSSAKLHASYTIQTVARNKVSVNSSCVEMLAQLVFLGALYQPIDSFSLFSAIVSGDTNANKRQGLIEFSQTIDGIQGIR
jgi:hypothetical protein